MKSPVTAHSYAGRSLRRLQPHGGSSRSFAAALDGVSGCTGGRPPSPPIDRTIADLQAQARQSVRARPHWNNSAMRLSRRREPATTPATTGWPRAPPPVSMSSIPAISSALLLRGHALHQLHRFQEAEAIARTLVTKTRVRSRLRAARRCADGAGTSRRSRRRVPEDDRSQTLLSVVHARRASCGGSRAISTAPRSSIAEGYRGRPVRATPSRSPGLIHAWRSISCSADSANRTPPGDRSSACPFNPITPPHF